MGNSWDSRRVAQQHRVSKQLPRCLAEAGFGVQGFRFGGLGFRGLGFMGLGFGGFGLGVRAYKGVVGLGDDLSEPANYA